MALPQWDQIALSDTQTDLPDYAHSNAHYLGLVYQQQRTRLPKLTPSEAASLVVDYMLVAQYMLSRQEMSLVLRVGQEDAGLSSDFSLHFNIAVTGYIESHVSPSPVHKQAQLRCSSDYDALTDQVMGQELVRLALWNTHG